MVDAPKSLRDFRHPSLLVAASTFIVLSLVLIYVAIENQSSGTPGQTIGSAGQSAPVFPPWFEYSVMGAWSVSLLALVLLYLWSRKPRTSVPYPEATEGPA